MKTLFNQKQLPLQKRKASIDGLDTAFWEGGTPGATPIILLHGLNGSHHGLWPLAARFADYHLFLPDLPGHGATELPQVASVAGVVNWFKAYVNYIVELTGKKPVVIAHSFGSHIAFLACQHIPAKYSTCILLTPVPRVSFWPYIFGKSLALMPPNIALDRMGKSARIRYWRDVYLLHRRSAAVNTLVRWVGMQSPHTPQKFSYYIHLSQELMGADAYTSESAHKGRFYCIAADSDRMLTAESRLNLQRLFGADHFYLCADTGHLMPIEAPDETASIVRELLPPA